ncbi:FeoA family protein [Stakelama tenebrarum]|uniref:Ferrous iron transport protein A n=1 Tax=Stakelama tenebrarum TaxID=2711215 RepID=A0A6G6Y0Z9_9SPHN|nr:FeoA family protein [Sphingosinithalassobacter tenebrarum]QIG78487.1 ferrous iron transport protein A [Sphingosinithalassobacter tenebrarum]
MATAPDISAPLRLLDLACNQPARVTDVDWALLSPPEARRLRELGLDEGVDVALIKRSGVLGGPVACRIGRMTVAMRRHVAGAIRVERDG